MRRMVFVPLAAALVFGACSEMDVSSPEFGKTATVPVATATGAGVTPTLILGNIPGTGAEVCMDPRVNPLEQEWLGLKVDPPVDHVSGIGSFILSSNGLYLDWTAPANVTIHAVIVKGGPNTNLYSYLTRLSGDTGLQSPQHGQNIPAISHYVVCYSMTSAPGEGCTPGYWRNHADRWVGVAPSDDFDATFGVDLFSQDVTLGWAIWAQGGGVNAFARHATAALLSAHAGVLGSNGQFVNYPYTVAEVVEMVQDAVAGGSLEATKDLFEAANELGCPLSGTSAVSVVP